MNISLPLPQDKKLTVICRVEPGCLGPEGGNYIEGFCAFAQQEFASINSDFVHWEIVPRYDKSLPEMQYNISNKKLSHNKAAKYLEIFKKNIDAFEAHLNEKLVYLIDQYRGHQSNEGKVCDLLVNI